MSKTVHPLGWGPMERWGLVMLQFIVFGLLIVFGNEILPRETAEALAPVLQMVAYFLFYLGLAATTGHLLWLFQDGPDGLQATIETFVRACWVLFIVGVLASVAWRTATVGYHGGVVAVGVGMAVLAAIKAAPRAWFEPLEQWIEGAVDRRGEQS